MPPARAHDQSQRTRFTATVFILETADCRIIPRGPPAERSLELIGRESQSLGSAQYSRQQKRQHQRSPATALASGPVAAIPGVALAIITEHSADYPTKQHSKQLSAWECYSIEASLVINVKESAASHKFESKKRTESHSHGIVFE